MQHMLSINRIDLEHYFNIAGGVKKIILPQGLLNNTSKK